MTRPIRGRDQRAQRKEVRRVKEWGAVRGMDVVGTEPDDLSTWLDDSPFTLPDGGGVDPKQPWKLPEEPGQ